MEAIEKDNYCNNNKHDTLKMSLIYTRRESIVVFNNWGSIILRYRCIYNPTHPNFLRENYADYILSCFNYHSGMHQNPP